MAEGNGVPCLADVSRPGFWKTGPDSDLRLSIVDGGGFHGRLGPGLGDRSVGGRTVGPG